MLVVILVIQCKKDEPEPEPEPPKEFKIVDGNFLNALIERGVDTNNDHIIDSTEAEAVYYLNIDSCGISIITGIQNFINLKELRCQDNNISSLDVSYNTALEVLYCNNNQLTKLIVSGDTSLLYLYCFHNQLATLDVSKNTNLSVLDLNYMPSLFKVCVRTIPFPPGGFILYTTGSPNVFFTTDCNK